MLSQGPREASVSPTQRLSSSERGPHYLPKEPLGILEK